MIESMTGFGSCSIERDGLFVSVEIRSVNSRFFDFSLKSSRGLGSFEDEMRQKVKQECRRGNISLSISAGRNDSSIDGEVRFDKGRFEAYATILDTIHREYGKKIDIEDVIDINDFLLVRETVNLDKTVILDALTDAIQEMKSMRLKEGKLIAEALNNGIDRLDGLLKEIQSISRNSLPVLKDSYKHRIQELVAESEVNLDHNRILQEAAILAEKLDITEECVRCVSHFTQFKTLLTVEETVGKRMNFLLQEINREINTIGSKANHLGITHHVIDMKDEIEKLREQVQNVL